MRGILLSFALSAAFLSGCASIVKGSSQDIAIATKPEGARFSIKDNRHGNTVREGVTPGSVSLEKGSGYFKGADYTVTLTKEGYAPQTIDVKSSASGWYIGGNLIIGGLIGWVIVDPLTGAMWKLTPEGIETSLEPARAEVRPPLAPPAAKATESGDASLPDFTEAAPAPRPHSIARADDPNASVSERLETLKQRRINGEMSGEEYLAERRRILDGQ